MLGGSSETKPFEDARSNGDVELINQDSTRIDHDKASSDPPTSAPNAKNDNDKSRHPFSSRVEATKPGVDPERVGALVLGGIAIDLQPVPGQSEADPPGKESVSRDIMELAEQTIDSAFGIAYEPLTTCAKSSYNLLPRTAFVDEDQFEKQMDAEFRVDKSVESLLQTTSCAHVPAWRGGERGKDDKIVQNEESDDSSGGISIQVPVKDMRPTVFKRLSKSLGHVPQHHPNIVSCTINESSVSGTERNPCPKPDIQLACVKALKQLTDNYQEARTVTQKYPSDVSHTGFVSDDREGAYSLYLSSTSEVAVGGDVRCSPVKEEGEKEEEEEEVENGQGKEQDVIKKGTSKGKDQQQREHEGEQHTAQERERERGRGHLEEEGERDGETPRDRAVREWEAIDKLRTRENSRPMEKGVGGGLRPVSIDEDSRVISTAEVLSCLRSRDLSMYKAVIVPVQPQRGRLRLFRWRPPLQISEGDKLRDEVFLIAQVHYTPDDVMHRRLIQTIYRRMTREERASPDVGPHWETIGFQGNDPRTDLNRSMGVFSLVQVLYLLEVQPEFAAVLHRNSATDVTGWPFLCVSIGFTKEAVGALRRGACNSECNRRGSVMEVVHELHQAQFHAFLFLCRRMPATHHAVHLTTVRTSIGKDPGSLLKAYRSYLSSERDRKAANVLQATCRRQGREHLNFCTSRAVGNKQRAVLSARQLRYVTTDEQKGS